MIMNTKAHSNCSQFQAPVRVLFGDSSRLTAGFFLRLCCCSGECALAPPTDADRIELGAEQAGDVGRLRCCPVSRELSKGSGAGAARGADGGLRGTDGGLRGAEGGLLGSIGLRKPSWMRSAMSSCPASAGSIGGSGGASDKHGGAGGVPGTGAEDSGSTVGLKKPLG